jgi:hypothetical protein
MGILISGGGRKKLLERYSQRVVFVDPMSLLTVSRENLAYDRKRKSYLVTVYDGFSTANPLRADYPISRERLDSLEDYVQCDLEIEKITKEAVHVLYKDILCQCCVYHRLVGRSDRPCAGEAPESYRGKPSPVI